MSRQIGKQLFTLCLLFLSILFGSAEQSNVLAKDLRAVLPSGDQIPMIGFGTYQIKGTEIVKNTLDNALAAGYRLFDSAAVYNNEEDIGKALKVLLPKYNLTRKDIFITSKLAAHNDTLGENAYASLEKSVKNLDCQYLDLYLIHFPGVPSSRENQSELRDESWKQLAKGVKDGLTNNIGVSNYNVKHLVEVVNNDHGVKVAVNQVEWQPFYHKDDVLDYCRKHGILLQAYSSFGGTGRTENLLTNPEVNKIANKLSKKPSQILLRWALQEKIAVIPKSLSKKHMELNLELDFEIPEEDMEILNKFPQREKNASWNPDLII